MGVFDYIDVTLYSESPKVAVDILFKARNLTLNLLHCSPIMSLKVSISSNHEPDLINTYAK